LTTIKQPVSKSPGTVPARWRQG